MSFFFNVYNVEDTYLNAYEFIKHDNMIVV